MKTKTDFNGNGMWLQMVLATLVVLGATAYVERNNIGTVFQAGNSEKEVTASLYPKKITALPGTGTSTTVLLTTPTNKIGYVQIALSFNRDVLNFTGTDDSFVSPNFEIISPVDTDAANSTGIITAMYGIKDDNGPTDGSVQLSKFNFTVKADGDSAITVDPSQSQIVFDNQAAETADILVNGASFTTKPETASPVTQMPVNTTATQSPESTSTATAPAAVTPTPTIIPEAATPTPVPPTAAPTIQPTTTAPTPPDATSPAVSTTP
jgi:hypothetical protein